MQGKWGSLAQVFKRAVARIPFLGFLTGVPHSYVTINASIHDAFILRVYYNRRPSHSFLRSLEVQINTALKGKSHTLEVKKHALVYGTIANKEEGKRMLTSVELLVIIRNNVIFWADQKAFTIIDHSASDLKPRPEPEV
ncbi:MAG: hypothetical protein L6Q57_07630 [Alphaproteobacteria bacterium]|nr:hypothetical protein [Alphaproteobacteria bacterium]